MSNFIPNTVSAERKPVDIVTGTYVDYAGVTRAKSVPARRREAFERGQLVRRKREIQRVRRSAPAP